MMIETQPISYASVREAYRCQWEGVNLCISVLLALVKPIGMIKITPR